MRDWSLGEQFMLVPIQVFASHVVVAAQAKPHFLWRSIPFEVSEDSSRRDENFSIMSFKVVCMLLYTVCSEIGQKYIWIIGIQCIIN